jgi:hypothetical protein
LETPLEVRSSLSFQMLPLMLSTSSAIQAGEIGGLYGPYPRHDSISSAASPSPLFSRRGSRMSTSDVAVELLSRSATTPSASPDRINSVSTLDLPRMPYDLSASSTSTNLPPFNEHGEEVYDTHHPPTEDPSPLSLPRPRFIEGIRRSQLGLPSVNSGIASPEFLWEKGNDDVDDFIHTPDPEIDAYLDKQRWKRASWEAASDTAFLLIVILVCLGIFLGWPVLRYGIIGHWGT